MKPLVIPALCFALLSAILSSGLSHWWLLRHLPTILSPETPATIEGHTFHPSSQPTTAAPVEAPHSTSPSAATTPTSPTIGQASVAAETEGLFLQISALTEKIGRLETKNRDLTAQLAETNSDLMKLEFRVDTHSESFRPLPTTESTSPTPGHAIPEHNEEISLLPLRAEPVTEEEIQQNPR